MRDSRQGWNLLLMTCLPVPNASSRAAYVQQSHLFCEVSKDVLRSPNDGESVLLCVIFKLELIITDTILTSEQDCSEFKKCIIYLRMTNPFDEPAKQGEAVKKHWADHWRLNKVRHCIPSNIGLMTIVHDGKTFANRMKSMQKHLVVNSQNVLKLVTSNRRHAHTSAADNFFNDSQQCGLMLDTCQLVSVSLLYKYVSSNSLY